MYIPFKKKKTFKERIKEFIKNAPDLIRQKISNLPSKGYVKEFTYLKYKKAKRLVRYILEDAWFKVKKLEKHLEVILFSLILLLAVVMFTGASSANFINTLVALLLLVLIVVIYSQLRMQKKMLDQYVPKMDFVRISRCHAYSDRIRTVNIYGAKDNIDKIKKVKNFSISYVVTNDSFSPVSVQAASLVIVKRGGKKIFVPSTMSILEADPKKTATSKVNFKLKNEVDFDSIDWVELVLEGNCKKTIRVNPVLYANLLLRKKIPEFIFESYKIFRKRKEIRM